MSSMESESFQGAEFDVSPEETDEEVFQSYMEDLRLSPEDFEKKILDIGAGSAQFSKWAKEHGVSSNVFSLEIRPGALLDRGKAVAGAAESLPFADGSFDLIVSDASMPHVIEHGADNEGVSLKERVRNAFSEMMRVSSADGEIRLARVLIGDRTPPQKEMKKAILSVLENLKTEHGVDIQMIHMPDADTYEYENDGKTRTDKILAKGYLIVINKKKRLRDSS